MDFYIKIRPTIQLPRPIPGKVKDVYKHVPKAGVSGYTPTGALALMAQQHEVVHVIYCQSLITTFIPFDKK